MKIRAKLFRSIWFWALVALAFVALFLYLYEMRPWLMAFPTDGAGIAPNIAPADTYTYWFHASKTPLVALPYNLIGPVSLIKLFGGNFDLIFLFNVVLFCLALRILYRYARVRVLKFSVLFLANPLLMVQFFSVNKEILITIALLFIVGYIYSGMVRHLIIAITLAAFSKPAFLVLVIFFLVARRLRARRRPFILLTIVVLISLFYSDVPGMEAFSHVLLRGQTSASLGITVLLQKLAMQYYSYAGILVPRLLLVVYAGGALNAVFFLSVVLIAILKRRLRLVDDAVFLLYLFLIMVSVIPFPHFRYILPTYPLLLFLVLRPRRRMHVLHSRRGAEFSTSSRSLKRVWAPLVYV